MQGVLRDGLLEGRRVAITAPARPELAPALTALGAAVSELAVDLVADAANEAAAKALGPLDALLIDGAALFATAADTRDAGSEPPRAAAGAAQEDELARAVTGAVQEDELTPLRAAADTAWAAARAVANAAWIEPGRPGKIILVAPPPDAGPHAEATIAAYENLARTTSIEWSRYRITPTAITPATTPIEEVATVVAYLISPAGDYFSGARLDLT